MLRVGIAGFGNVGKLRAKAIDKIKNAELVAIYDMNLPDSIEGSIQLCQSYEDLLDQNLDAVFDYLVR